MALAFGNGSRASLARPGPAAVPEATAKARGMSHSERIARRGPRPSWRAVQGDRHRALVVGETGGIGKAVATSLRARGADVTGLSRADGLDVTDAASVERALAPLAAPFDLIFVATGALAPPGMAPRNRCAHWTPARSPRSSR